MFKTMTSVLNKKSNPSEQEIEKIPSFIFLRWLSGSPMAILAANQINYYYNIPIVNQFKLIKSVFAGKIKYIPYPKKTGEESQKQIKYLCVHYNISEEKAKEYLDFISPHQLKEIVDMYEEQELKTNGKIKGKIKGK